MPKYIQISNFICKFNTQRTKCKRCRHNGHAQDSGFAYVNGEVYEVIRSSGHQVISSSVHGLIAFGYHFELRLSLSSLHVQCSSNACSCQVAIWANPARHPWKAKHYMSLTISNSTSEHPNNACFAPVRLRALKWYNGGQSSDGKNTAVTYHFHAFRLCFLLMLKPCFSHLFGVRL